MVIVNGIDLSKSPLDGRIPGVVSGIIEGLDQCIKKAEDDQQERVLREPQRVLERQNQAEREAEGGRRKTLETLARANLASAEVAQLANAVEEAFTEMGLLLESMPVVSSWLQCAREHAARLDPIESIVRELMKTHGA